MSDLSKYFDVAYLVNLPERTDRLKAAKKQLANAGWTLGANGVKHYRAQKFTERAGFPSPGVRGCFQSHFDCIRTAHLQGKKSLLVIEDDVAFTSQIAALTPLIISQLEAKRWDFLYLGHEYTGPIPLANSQTTDVSLLPFGAEIRTTHCYAVNGRIFPRLLEHLERVATGIEGDQEFGPMPIDGAFNIFRRNNADVKTLIAQPKLCWQLSSRSDITPRFFDKVPWLHTLVRLLRNIKANIVQWNA